MAAETVNLKVTRVTGGSGGAKIELTMQQPTDDMLACVIQKARNSAKVEVFLPSSEGVAVGDLFALNWDQTATATAETSAHTSGFSARAARVQSGLGESEGPASVAKPNPEVAATALKQASSAALSVEPNAISAAEEQLAQDAEKLHALRHPANAVTPPPAPASNGAGANAGQTVNTTTGTPSAPENAPTT